MSIIEGRNAEILQSIIDGTPYENPNPYPSRIEQLLMELKEVIEQGGGGATVDQTYTPTSENAQSGTAVAEALETIPSVTVDQTFDPTSANAQSGVAVQEAIDSRLYTVSLGTPSATYMSTQAFTNPSGNPAYISILAFHVNKTAPAGIPAGKYVAMSPDFGAIGFTIENDRLIAHCVVTTYGSNNWPDGTHISIAAGFYKLPAYKID